MEKMKCQKGHALTLMNTRVAKNGRRECLTCRMERRRKPTPEDEARERIAKTMKRLERLSGGKWTREHKLWVERKLREREGLDVAPEHLGQLYKQIGDMGTHIELAPNYVRAQL